MPKYFHKKSQKIYNDKLFSVKLKMRALWSKLHFIAFFSQKCLRFSKMDKNKCPNLNFPNTFGKKIFTNIYYF